MPPGSVTGMHDAGSVGDDADDGDDGGLVRGRNGSRADPARGIGDSLREQPDVECPTSPPSGDRRAGAASAVRIPADRPYLQRGRPSLSGLERGEPRRQGEQRAVRAHLRRLDRAAAVPRRPDGGGGPRRRKHGAGRASAPGVDRAERVAQRGDRLLGCLSRPGGSRTEHPQRAAAREATGGDPRSLSSGRGDPDRRFAGGSPVGARDGGADRREGALATSRATFRNVVGVVPEVLARPPLPRELPASLADANEIATDNNPNVTTAAFQERSARDSVDQVRGELWPTVSLMGRVQRDQDVSRRDSRFDSVEALVNLTVPLYQAGAVYSRLRQQKQVVAEQRRLLDQSQNNAVEDATRAWNSLETAGAEIGSFTKQVEANQIALDGVQKEAEVGARTVLDVLDAELLDSQVSLVRSQRDQVVAAFQLNAAVGELTARRLDLPVVQYDPDRHYREVRDEADRAAATR